ncbi:MAG: GntR family transcriptional regulator [Spirochaetia bacterium]
MDKKDRTLRDHQSLTERVYVTLREMILNMELPPGTRLKDVELATRLGVSNTPLREAIRWLAADSLVETIPRRGTFVKTLTPDDVGNLYEIREALEVLAVRKAAEKASPEMLSRIANAADRHLEAVESGHMQEYVILDRQFHMLIAEGAKNEVLQSMLNIISDRIHIMRRLTSNFEKDVETGHVHREIAAALKRRDSRGAVELMKRHIQRHGERIMEYLKEVSLATSSKTVGESTTSEVGA